MRSDKDSDQNHTNDDDHTQHTQHCKDPAAIRHFYARVTLLLYFNRLRRGPTIFRVSDLSDFVSRSASKIVCRCYARATMRRSADAASPNPNSTAYA